MEVSRALLYVLVPVLAIFFHIAICRWKRIKEHWLRYDRNMEKWEKMGCAASGVLLYRFYRDDRTYGWHYLWFYDLRFYGFKIWLSAIFDK